MPIVCNLAGLTNIASDCPSGKGGAYRIWVARIQDVDWVATAANVNATGALIAAPTMLGGAVFKELTSRKNGGQYTFNKADRNSDYAITINAIFDGKDSTRLKNLVQLQQCCLAFFVLGNDGVLRFGGKDFDFGTSLFENYTSPLKADGHNDTSGEYTGDDLNKGRDEITLTGESQYGVLYSTIAVSAIPV